ncbi:putative ankyrin repeat-containing domain, PGG domain, ankyrin repeat-containing domain superfamily [Helianthus annuus]|nr:putative ankyrin repeat-containing domain, PGG domain, ankyrin repeat-containing domain superfamily [Helianthus annuus]
MLCLLDSNNMGGIVDPIFVGPRYSSTDTVRQYDSLAKGWILGSVCEDLLVDVHNFSSAKAVWEELKSICDPAMCFQEDSISKKSDAETEKDVDRNRISAETNTVEEGANSIEIVVDQDIVPTETDTKSEREKASEFLKLLDEQVNRNRLHSVTKKGDWTEAKSILEKNKDLATEAVRSDGSTILHIAVGIGHNDFVKQLLSYMNDEQLLQRRDSDGSTSLHIAAIVGNTDVADLLVKRNKMLLRVKDNKGVEPLQKAYEYMHLDTIGYFLKAVSDDGKNELQSSLTGSVHPDDDIATDLLVNAISAKQYSLALELVQNFPESASRSDDVLMALAKNFPSGLDHWETLVSPSPSRWLDDFMLQAHALIILFLLGFPMFALYKFIVKRSPSNKGIGTLLFKLVILTVAAWLALPLAFTRLLILAARFIFRFLYSFLWKGAKILFAPIKRIENKKNNLDDARLVLGCVCDAIDKLEKSGSDQSLYTEVIRRFKKSGTDHPYYTRPILEAACQNVYEVVDKILLRSPKAIQSSDKSGYDIIQLAILNRSEKIYNLIYDIGERKNLYRIYNDSFKNNILHLAGRLAPSSVLNQRTGAALQLQRELQWREEVKKFVFPTYTTQENIFKETPDMVFTREHENLVKEGEKWMKTTAESCSITAALITTIVFAAAITVPGGSNQEKGTPLFKKEGAFITFAISDAISLFSSVTALLVFLSILTTRFAEKDFLVSLPRRLFIGLFSLFLSTTTMMIAFSATVFLVFCDQNPWMILPISGLAFIPIASFVTLQFPLMVDLFRSTYIPIFGKKKEKKKHLISRIIDKMLDHVFHFMDE